MGSTTMDHSYKQFSRCEKRELANMQWYFLWSYQIILVGLMNQMQCIYIQ